KLDGLEKGPACVRCVVHLREGHTEAVVGQIVVRVEINSGLEVLAAGCPVLILQSFTSLFKLLPRLVRNLEAYGGNGTLFLRGRSLVTGLAFYAEVLNVKVLDRSY